jgi:hypothetical protein
MVKEKTKKLESFDDADAYFYRLKNGKPIEQTPKLRIPKKDGWGIITIEKATSLDSGVYQCIASNSFNLIKTESKVTVFDVEEICVKPTFTRITGN